MSKNSKGYKEFKDLSESSKKRLTSTLKKIHTAGFTLTEAKHMDDLELRNLLQSKAKTMDSERRILNQITFDKDRRNNVRQKALDYYSNFGYRGKGLIEVNKELIKTVGSVFFSIAYDLRKKYNENEEKSYEHAKRLLNIPESRYKQLERKERSILRDYDY